MDTLQSSAFIVSRNKLRKTVGSSLRTAVVISTNNKIESTLEHDDMAKVPHPIHFPANLTDTLTIQERRIRKRRAKQKLMEEGNNNGPKHDTPRKSIMFDTTATSATLDRMAFSINTDSVATPLLKVSKDTSIKKNLLPREPKEMRWYVALPGNTRDTPIDTNRISTTLTYNAHFDLKSRAQLFFRVPNTVGDNPQQGRILLASLLHISEIQAEHIIQKAPSLANQQVTNGTLESRCVALCLLLQCTPHRLASVVRRCPSILTYKSSTLARKMVELDSLLSRQNVSGSVDVDLSQVESSTIAIANRVPALLVSDIRTTLQRHAHELRIVLFGVDVDETTNGHFKRVLHRCPELLMHDITKTIAPKIHILNVS